MYSTQSQLPESNNLVSDDPMGIVEFYQFLASQPPTLSENPIEPIIEDFQIQSFTTKKFVNEFWTSRQRQSNSLHEISYRACFKAQLPNFFITKLTSPKELVYDPFGGRGTTIIEANLLSRRGISNDINPLSSILTKPRLAPPEIHEIADRLTEIEFDQTKSADIDLSMFFHKDTEGEIVSLRHYLKCRSDEGTNDPIDDWIRMVATNRLTGHSKGFFSVYTLPPNQATSQKNQQKINIRRKQSPEYRNIKELILRKSSSLLKGTNKEQRSKLRENAVYQRLCVDDARHVCQINDETVQLIVTSPPFLDIVNYRDDNWLRCWFNCIDLEEISKKLTVLSSIDKWIEFMQEVFLDLYRVTNFGGWVAFEVGEVRKGKIKLDEYIAPVGEKAGFNLFGIIINKQNFTKTSNIWGINNNEAGTNTNRIVVFYKE